MRKVVLADDSISMQKFVWHTLSTDDSFDLKFVNSPQKLPNVLSRFQPDVILVHLEFFEEQVQEQLTSLSQRSSHLLVFVESDFEDSTAPFLKNLSAQIIKKPVSSEQFLAALRQLEEVIQTNPHPNPNSSFQNSMDVMSSDSTPSDSLTQEDPDGISQGLGEAEGWDQASFSDEEALQSTPQQVSETFSDLDFKVESTVFDFFAKQFQSADLEPDEKESLKNWSTGDEGESEDVSSMNPPPHEGEDFQESSPSHDRREAVVDSLKGQEELIIETVQQRCEDWLRKNFRQLAKDVLQEEISKLVEDDSRD